MNEIINASPNQKPMPYFEPPRLTKQEIKSLRQDYKNMIQELEKEYDRLEKEEQSLSDKL